MAAVGNTPSLAELLNCKDRENSVQVPRRKTQVMNKGRKKSIWPLIFPQQHSIPEDKGV